MRLRMIFAITLFGVPAAAPAAVAQQSAAAAADELKKVGKILDDMTALSSDTALAAWKRLAEMGNLATPALLHYLSKGNLDQRIQAAEALGDLKDPAAGTGLIAALQERESELRLFAARALGEIGLIRGVKPLHKLLTDPDDDVRAAAAWALVELSDRSVLRAYYAGMLRAESSYDRERAAKAFGRLGTGQDAAKLAPLIQDENRDLRLQVIYSLGSLGSAEAIDLLIEALNDDHRRNRATAHELLQQLTGERSMVLHRDKWQLWWQINRQGYQLKKTGSAEPKVRKRGKKIEKEKTKSNKLLDHLIRQTRPKDEKKKPKDKAPPPEPEGDVPII